MNDMDQVTPGGNDREHGSLLVTTIPAPVVALDDVFSQLREEGCSLLWDPPHGAGIVAAGLAASVTGSGSNRVTE